jgi:hypothetical protein
MWFRPLDHNVVMEPQHNDEEILLFLIIGFIVVIASLIAVAMYMSSVLHNG